MCEKRMWFSVSENDMAFLPVDRVQYVRFTKDTDYSAIVWDESDASHYVYEPMEEVAAKLGLKVVTK